MIEQEEVVQPTELESVKEIASNMGLKVGNIKNVDKIKELIAAANEPKTAVPVKPITKLQRHAAIRKAAMKLVRVRITPMSPFERQLSNTLVDVGSAKLGNVKRVVPFNEIWHVEQIVLDELRSRKFRTKKETTDPQTRRKVYTNVFSASYGIEILTDLTKDELTKLAADQSARHAID